MCRRSKVGRFGAFVTSSAFIRASEPLQHQEANVKERLVFDGCRSLNTRKALK